MMERLATSREVGKLRRALAQASVDEAKLYRAGLIHLHDNLYDGPLMGAMDKAIEGRPVDPARLRAAMALLARHHDLARTRGGT